MSVTRLTNRHILVTGAAQGIGQAVALRLAAEGARLTLMDRSGDGLEGTARLFAESGLAPPHCAQVDITDTAAAVGAIARADEASPLDGLVNVAGIGLCAQFLELDLQQWRRTLDVNLTATFALCQEAGRRMAGRGSGRIINMASIAGKTGSEVMADYCASKAGVISLTQSAARALGSHGVTVNAVCPGLVWTPMWHETASWMASNNPRFASAGLTPAEVYQASVASMTPLRRPTTTEDIAGTVAFLLSDDAKLITGQAINVDGGIEVH